jgi:hypothetical protein
MTVADILYFASLASAAFISTAVLLRQFFHGDLAEHRKGIRRRAARSALRTTPGRRLAVARLTVTGAHRRRAA